MASVTLTFPDGAKQQVESGTTALDVAKGISNSLAKAAVAATVNGNPVDLLAPIKQDAKITIVTKKDALGLAVLRNTGAFLLAAAVHKSFPSYNLGEGKAQEDGFFYDTDNPANGENQIAVTDLPALEKEMKAAVKDDDKIERVLMDKEELAKHFADDPYKAALVKAQAGVQIPVHKLGDFIDFGYGPILPDTKLLKHFSLLSVAGAYWQGKSSNPMLQRIYGTAFFSADELEADAKRRADIKERDHRTIGRELDLFFVDPSVGAGLAYWMPKGATIRRTIERYIIDKEIANGYEHVYTPILANLDLYKQSGHWDHYKDDMFPPMDMGDGEMLELRPMNCPSHIQIYKHHIRSYRELPIRIAELGMMHRYEKSGALSGLQRVREMTLNDGHTFVAPDQIQDEFKKILTLMMDVYADFDINDYSFRLSYRDPKNTAKYFDDDAMWNKSQAMLKGAMDDLGLDYYEAEGEAAFYGPKLDVQTKTALGNDETLSTIQLDFMMPEKFHLTYVGDDGEEHRPVMIHRGVISTMERFIAYLTEIYKGAFPTWLSPIQCEIIPVNTDLHMDYALEIKKRLLKEGVRVEVDDRNEKMGYKIRESQTQKIPYTLVVGDEEKKDSSVSVRRYGEDKTESQDLEMFIDAIVADIKNYSRTGSAKNSKVLSALDKN
ncbi:threonine--tRNA ligase [Schleiferilactobacillus perolens]|jgi:threonyl-tRNA synthetase|uniref:threonine--tRNA ligase n=1 Tax=Schleiferilactobacillus perolens TaxID=100468 RepID=UPI00235513A8|nr:threonine--tRNA ligase [Schleiferilactobacillus perolens]MCI1891364.1 threonine--tRNA ligase [Schleiferilactobacillus harbinensis]MCI1912310.1 threonine--tRNA ligase [Schleiferilactobacillus harbinensis]MCI2170623.1 threonine--tRNA ligase [Schleiferilactobacillus perolens]